MDEETQDAQVESDLSRSFDFLSRSRSLPEITVRDDQYEFPWLHDAVKACRGQRKRFRLVDSGHLNRDQLEWLGQAGCDIYTDDSVGRSEHDLDVINRACTQGRAILAYFFHGPLDGSQDAEEPPYSQLIRLGNAGIYIHISNREKSRDLALLASVAHACRRGGGWLVYYHHGEISGGLIDVAESGSWIHMEGDGLNPEGGIQIMRDVLKASQRAGTGLVLYVEDEVDITWLWDVLKGGGVLLFRNEHFDFRSPYRAVEEAAHKRLDHRAYFLDTTHLP